MQPITHRGITAGCTQRENQNNILFGSEKAALQFIAD